MADRLTAKTLEPIAGDRIADPFAGDKSIPILGGVERVAEHTKNDRPLCLRLAARASLPNVEFMS